MIFQAAKTTTVTQGLTNRFQKEFSRICYRFTATFYPYEHRLSVLEYL